MRRLLTLALWISLPLAAQNMGDVAKAIRENVLDRDECYRVRDITLVREDIRVFLSDGHLIFSKPVAGRRIAAVFANDVDGGDGEVMLLPPNRAERKSLAGYTESPNLDEHFSAAFFLFTGDEYEAIKAQFPNNPANRKSPEVGVLMEEQWSPVLRNLGASYQTRLTLDLIAGAANRRGLFAAMFNSPKYGTFDVVFDPSSPEQITAGRLGNRNGEYYFDIWTNFPARSTRNGAPAPRPDLDLADYRIEATVNADLSLTAVTRVKVTPVVDGLRAAPFDIADEMQITEARIDGKPAEILQRESTRTNAMRGGNSLFLVGVPEPLRAGRQYEFEFHHTGKVIQTAGERVFYVAARGNWYPAHGLQFANYDLQFRYPRDLDLVTAGEVVEEREEGEWRILRRRTGGIRVAGFNLGSYERVRFEKSGYVVEVCANRNLEKALLPRPQAPIALSRELPVRSRRADSTQIELTPRTPPNPLERLHTLAANVASALEFMSARFGPPALPHLVVSPIPGTFGQGFPGLIYLSTLAYIEDLHAARPATSESQEIFFEDVLLAHETAHQWWGNRITAASYRDYWLMEALANYSALMYMEKTRGLHPVELMLDTYRDALLLRGGSGATVDATGPIVLGTRLENSQEPRAWRNITYGKGSWILQMLRRRLGDERFLAMLAEMAKRFDKKEITTEEFRELAAKYLPPKTDDPKLEQFFDQWVYGIGIPTIKMSYSLKGKAPALRLVGTLTQSEVDEDFSAEVPVEIQLAKGKTITHWVRSRSTPVSFTVPLEQAPQRVTLDPRHGVLRK